MSKTTRVYIAGRFDRKNELATYAAQLEEIGLACTSRWLTGVHDATSEKALTERELAVFAHEDHEDIRSADWLVLFLEDPSAGYMTGGRHVETGIALERGMPVYLIGEAGENVFHAEVTRFPTWQHFLHACDVMREVLA